MYRSNDVMGPALHGAESVTVRGSEQLLNGTSAQNIVLSVIVSEKILEMCSSTLIKTDY